MAKNKLSPLWIALIVIAAIVVLGGLWLIGSYNGLVSSQVNVDQKWANVQTAYQRRADLIPNLVATVKGSSDFEKKMQTDIAALRTGISNAKTPAEIDLMGQKVNTAINLVYENYPQIKSTENYLSLQDELAGTENRVKVERDLYNQAVRDYSIRIRRFPTNIVAGMFGFGPKEMFQADEGADKAPQVKF